MFSLDIFLSAEGKLSMRMDITTHELSNYKENLISRFIVLCDMSTALGSKKSFLKKWNSLEHKQNPEHKILVIY